VLAFSSRSVYSSSLLVCVCVCVWLQKGNRPQRRRLQTGHVSHLLWRLARGLVLFSGAIEGRAIDTRAVVHI